MMVFAFVQIAAAEIAAVSRGGELRTARVNQPRGLRVFIPKG